MTVTQRRPTDYRYIAAWGRMLGSYQYYILDQQAEAHADNAPIDAVYKGQDGEWVRFGTVTNPDAIAYFEARGLKHYA